MQDFRDLSSSALTSVWHMHQPGNLKFHISSAWHCHVPQSLGVTPETLYYSAFSLLLEFAFATVDETLLLPIKQCFWGGQTRVVGSTSCAGYRPRPRAPNTVICALWYPLRFGPVLVAWKVVWESIMTPGELVSNSFLCNFRSPHGSCAFLDASQHVPS